MKSGSLPPGGCLTVVAQPDWRRKVDAWRELLGQCCRKPSRKCVHALRVATLRLQVELEYGLRERPQEDAAARAARRWRKQAKKLRRALQPVREADVFLGKLASLRGSTREASQSQVALSRRCLKQIGELEQKLKKRRQTAARNLVAKIRDRLPRLERLSADIEAAKAPQMLFSEDAAEDAVSKLVSSLAEKYPELNGENLHEYRKDIKRANYLAELFASAGSHVAEQAAVLKKMQVAVGEWHDLEMLGAVAARTMGKHDTQDGLVDLVKTLTASSLEKALGQCRQSMVQLLKHDTVNQPSLEALPPKLSVRGEALPPADEKRRYA